MLKTRHLEAFVEVARQGSVTLAARTLGLTQPAVSRTLRELEIVAGTALLERDGRGVRPTRAGEIFLRHAGASLASLRGGLEALRTLGADDGPRLRIGALPTVSASVMPEVMRRYLESISRNRVMISTGDNRHLFDALRRDELDLVVGRMAAPEFMQGLSFEVLYHERVVFVVDRGHPLAETAAGRHPALPPHALHDYTVLMPTLGSIIRPSVDRLLIEQGLAEPRRALETVSDSFGRAFVRNHQAIWVISEGVVRADIESGAMVALALDTTSTTGPIGVALNANAAPGPGLTVFIEILREVVAMDSRG